ncbi:TonB-dependent receptor domain-containing protein [Gallibacterium salpingitidis]|uniref:Iron-regulated outer membrane virulence protein n=1 Tax=Gallibacterium salpingitidis TaxID=505341 RepID=A0A1A7P022_9PAST|nr:TonB-dependent receptor [Gallibacterium salpingitidis]OBW95313.1 iron-regulated outer membrane virulence protein [Gallibacterium salpingitidis]
MRLTLSAISLCVATILANQAFAASTTNESSTLDDIVVTASGSTQSYKDAPASITVINNSTLEKQPVANLIDAVKYVPGVSISGSDVNKEDISIRGLPGDYTLILVNGRRQNTREARPNGNGGFEAGLMPPVSAIQRIEVIRGPMSSLYGSDAMGGVINIITKENTDKWEGSLSLGGIARQGSNGEEGLSSFFISGPLIANKLGVQLYGNGQLRQEDPIEGGSNKLKNGALTSKLIFTPNEKHKFEFEAGRNRQEKTATPGESLAATTNRGGSITKNVQSTTKFSRNHWAISHYGDWGKFNSEISLYQETAKREVWSEKLKGYDPRSPEITNTVFDAKFMLPLGSHFFVFGGQYQHAKLEDDSVTKVVNKKAKTQQLEESMSQKALFLEDEISLTKDLLLTLGARMDHHEKYGTHWNPRAYLVYHLNNEWTVKGGVAKAFKAPSIREISPNYITSTQSGAGVIYGNADLKPETSVNQEIGVEYNGVNGLRASMTLFNTDFKNKLISYQLAGKTDPVTGGNLFTYDNVGKANIKGVELAAFIPLHKAWNLELNYTYQNSKRKEDKLPDAKFSYDGYPLANTPKHSANAKLNWQMNEQWDSYLRYNYVGKRIWADQRTGYSKGPARYADAYSTVDFGLNYQFSKDVLFSFAVLNIGNTRGETIDADNGGNWSVVDGRRYWANMTVSF